MSRCQGHLPCDGHFRAVYFPLRYGNLLEMASWRACRPAAHGSGGSRTGSGAEDGVRHAAQHVQGVGPLVKPDAGCSPNRKAFFRPPSYWLLTAGFF